MGIDIDRIIVIAFALGATLAAVAGVAQGLKVTATSTSAWASSPASRRSPPPSSAASATSSGAVVGGLILGIVEVDGHPVHPRQFGVRLEGRRGRSSS